MGPRPRPTNAGKRRAILEAAAALVAERGRDTSLAEVCRQAGVSRQTIYNHHRDRAGLLEAVAAEGVAPLPRCVREWTHTARCMTVLRARSRDLQVPAAARVGARGAAVRGLAKVLRHEALRGRLRVADAAAAADLFLDLVLAGPQLRIVLGPHDPPTSAEIAARSRRCARLFVRGCGDPPILRPRRSAHRHPVLRHATETRSPTP